MSSGFICDIGYDDSMPIRISRSVCQVCGNTGLVRWEFGWVGIRCFHLSKKCLGQWEIDGDWQGINYKSNFDVNDLAELKRVKRHARTNQGIDVDNLPTSDEDNKEEL